MYDANFKIILFGDETEGKKMLTHKYMINLFSSSQADSLGVDFEVKSLSVDKYKIKLQIWDISGDRRFRDFLPTYISHARGGLFVYDVTERSSLTNVNFWLTLVKKELAKEELFPIIVVGIIPESENQRQVFSEEGKKLANLFELDGFIECDIKSGDNTEKMFESLSKLMLEISSPPLESAIPKDQRKMKGNGFFGKKKSKNSKKKRKSKQ
jgi:Ras-related protein Rab-18